MAHLDPFDNCYHPYTALMCGATNHHPYAYVVTINYVARVVFFVSNNHRGMIRPFIQHTP